MKKLTKQILIHIVISLMIIVIGIIPIINFAEMDYNFEVDKCNNMKRSNYEFTHDVQINAEYSKDCYYTLNYPLAKLNYYSTYILTLILVVTFVNLLIALIIIITKTPFKDSNYY